MLTNPYIDHNTYASSMKVRTESQKNAVKVIGPTCLDREAAAYSSTVG